MRSEEGQVARLPEEAGDGPHVVDRSDLRGQLPELRQPGQLDLGGEDAARAGGPALQPTRTVLHALLVDASELLQHLAGPGPSAPVHPAELAVDQQHATPPQVVRQALDVLAVEDEQAREHEDRKASGDLGVERAERDDAGLEPVILEQAQPFADDLFARSVHALVAREAARPGRAV